MEFIGLTCANARGDSAGVGDAIIETRADGYRRSGEQGHGENDGCWELHLENL